MSMMATLAAGIVAAAITMAEAAGSQQAGSAQNIELSQQETELRVKNEVARRLGLQKDVVRVMEASVRVWPDAGLGCNARRGVLDPSPVRGFRIVAEAGGRRFVYHTDRHGRLLRCSTPGKPIDLIK